MSKLTKSYFFIIGLFLSAASFAAELTEENITKLLDQVDIAAMNLDVNSVASTLSDDISITMNITMQGEEHVMSPSKQEYLAMLQQGWSMYKDYQYDRSNVTIKIEGGKALVTADVKESMTIQGQNISAESQEEATVEVVNNALLITKIVGYSTM